MFKEVPVKKKWGKYVLLNSEDQERFGLSVTKKDFEKVLKKGVTILCFLNVILQKMYLEPVGYLIKNLMFMEIDVLDKVQEEREKMGKHELKMSEIWVKGYKDENGDIIISLGDDGYHRVLKDYVESGVVEVKEV